MKVESYIAVVDGLLQFMEAILASDSPVLTHFGIVNIESGEQHCSVSLWGCLVNGEEVLNPMRRIEYLANQNAALQARLAEIENHNRWTPIAEALPTKEGHYLVQCDHSFPKNCNVVVAEYYASNQHFYSEAFDEPIYDVTHWKPIDPKI